MPAKPRADYTFILGFTGAEFPTTGSASIVSFEIELHLYFIFIVDLEH